MDNTKLIEPEIDVKLIVYVIPYNLEYKKSLKKRSGERSFYGLSIYVAD